ncbi:copper homeostasis protein CutC [Aureisphaera sp. CAU 1614]|uniref:PF03932 family protein CutC n=1 Tax=Halomarinibacterium sedimenti TaxID=2857106 RepID=A0A9X1JUX4_9FLAO|nr:copper homeostasis protein CutC [Halomarinibacterium sedimenti]MBW2937354.1 copper homeostasis protein CutC [Halomarinibacterium sedimenti]
MILEICANSFESAMAAQKVGAHRIELCTELSLGGVTPSFGLIEKVLSSLTIPVHVLIRPRSGNFTYTESEVDVMLKDIQQCKKMGVAGIVTGALTLENEIDVETTQQLLLASEGLDVTFHRAFDWCHNPKKSLQELQQLGVKRILTSGQQPNAFEGLTLLKELKALSESIEIMPGGGIHSENVGAFKKAGFISVHCSASEKVQTLINAPKVAMQSALDEGVITYSSEEKIREILKKLA